MMKFISTTVLVLLLELTCFQAICLALEPPVDLKGNNVPQPPLVFPAGSLKYRGRLIKEFLRYYDKRFYPYSTVLAKVGISLVKLNVNEKEATMDTDVWFTQIWNDSRLIWNPKHFDNQTVIRVHGKDLWTPDLTLLNNVFSPDGFHCRDVLAMVYNHGEVVWIQPCHFRTHCNFSLDRAPFDEQTCMLQFGSWTYNSLLLDLKFNKNNLQADVTEFLDNTNWELTRNTAERFEKSYDCCRAPHLDLRYHLTFKRKTYQGSCGA